MQHHQRTCKSSYVFLLSFTMMRSCQLSTAWRLVKSNLSRMGSRLNMRIQIASSNRNEIIFAVKVFKLSKTAGVGGLPGKVFVVVPAELLLPLVQKLPKSEMFLREWKKRRIVCFENPNWNGIWGLPGIGKIIANPESMEIRLLLDGWPGSYYIDRLKIVQGSFWDNVCSFDLCTKYAKLAASCSGIHYHKIANERVDSQTHVAAEQRRRASFSGNPGGSCSAFQQTIAMARRRD